MAKATLRQKKLRALDELRKAQNDRARFEAWFPVFEVTDADRALYGVDDVINEIANETANNFKEYQEIYDYLIANK